LISQAAEIEIEAKRRSFR